MNKRGLTLELVVKAAILVIVLFVMGNFIRTTFLAGEEARQVILPDYGEFEPYEYEPVGEEATVSDSINALICAVNAVARLDKINSGYETFFEEKDWRKGTCEGGVVVEEIVNEDTNTEEDVDDTSESLTEEMSCSKGILYGSSCVQCFPDPESKFKCTISDFYLPQTGAGDRGTLDRWIAGLGDPEYIVYYEAFPEGEDEYWKPDYASYSPLILFGSVAASIFLPVDDDVNIKCACMANSNH